MKEGWIALDASLFDHAGSLLGRRIQSRPWHARAGVRLARA
jgi:hypothetical protein